MVKAHKGALAGRARETDFSLPIFFLAFFPANTKTSPDDEKKGFIFIQVCPSKRQKTQTEAKLAERKLHPKLSFLAIQLLKHLHIIPL